MQYIRCDACGAKALFAASRCPKCTHAFYLRDHRGEMVPLAHCRKCDTYYPRSVGGCKWCGTRTESNSLSGRTFLALGGVVLAVVAIVVATRFVRRDAGAATDTAVAEAPAVTPAPPPPAPAPAPDSVTDTSAAGTLPDTVPSAPAAAAPPVNTAPQVVTPSTLSAPTLPANVRWVKATAITYINVRSGPDRKAPVVGVVTPEMHVELGANMRGWRQVRAPGITGWADPRNFKD